MPFTLKLTTKTGNVIESPFIVPDNPRSKFGMENAELFNSPSIYGVMIDGRSINGSSYPLTEFNVFRKESPLLLNSWIACPTPSPRKSSLVIDC